MCNICLYPFLGVHPGERDRQVHSGQVQGGEEESRRGGGGEEGVMQSIVILSSSIFINKE